MENNLVNENIFFSLCIPAYDYNGNGIAFLENNFRKFEAQTFKNFEVVVSDHSVDKHIQELCDRWKIKLNLRYISNDRGRGYVSPNLNTAMSEARGEWIKIVFQDDFLFDENSLQRQFDFISQNENIHWFATRFVHTFDGINFYRDFMPKWSDDIWTGNNTIGGPSVVTIKNNSLIYFDEELNWLLDCDWYYKLFQKFGKPSIFPEITVVSRSNPDRLTNRITPEQKKLEFKKLQNIYA